MKWLIALFSACLISTAAMAAVQQVHPTAEERLRQESAEAGKRAGEKSFAEAAAILEKLAGDLEITTLPAWPNTLYPLARYQARAGRPDQALSTLTHAVDVGATPAADDVANEADFASVRERPEFKALVARLVREAALWKDSPALATPFKPVLSEEEKVAGLSKIWSEARFNFPFFGRIPEVDWDAQYMAFLPQVRAAKTTEDYYRVLARFVAVLKDGHTRLIAPKELYDRLYGVAPLRTQMVEGKILVMEVQDSALAVQGVKPGAELFSINARDALAYAKSEIEPVVFGFTQQDRDAWTYGYELLRGPVDEPMRLGFRLEDGSIRVAIVHRHKSQGWFGYFPEIAERAHFEMLPGNVAYLRIHEFMDDAGIKALRENFAAVSKADGLILDIRINGGGDDRNMTAILEVLADKPYVGSNWRTRDYQAALRGWHREQGWVRGDGGHYQPSATMHYSGPVAVLTSALTYSASEDFLVALRTMKRGKLIGEPSGGSTGNPMLFGLPGGGTGFICTKDDSYPDGRLFGGIGVIPDIRVAPTIADIRAGRDVVLEKALEALKAK